MLDRSAILRAAHAQARFDRANVLRISGRLDPYHRTLAYCLRQAWRAAKDRIRQAAADAAFSVLQEAEADAEIAATPRNVAARIDALRAFAATMPDHWDGRRQRGVLLAEADDLAMAARAMMIPAPELCRHAH